MDTTNDLECSVRDVAQLLNTDPPPKLLDIRQPHEFEIARLENGMLLTQPLVDEVLERWNRDTPIVCYCHHGVRSLQATVFLRQQGFKNVRSMKGGIHQWAIEIDPSMDRY